MSFYIEDYYDFTSKDVDTVSELRHYNNVYQGDLSEIIKKFKTDYETLYSIMSSCFGSEDLRSLTKNKEYLEKAISEYKAVQLSKLQAQIKNDELIEILRNKRKSFCEVGTRRTKLNLNKLSKANPLAHLYRVALEIEDKNITAKDTIPYYRKKVYKEKHKLIVELIKLINQYKLGSYGKQKSDVNLVSDIIYFDLPNCEQISFHCDLPSELSIPDYNKEWDKKENSTLNKLEVSILELYKKIESKK